jgi:protein SCO1/2
VGARALRAAALAACTSVLASGCHRAVQNPAQAASGETARQYPIRGVVVSTDAKDGTVMLNHQAVPGLMEAMTMAYPVVDRAAIGEMHPGDTISATLLADPSAQGPVNLRLKDIVITVEANPDYVPTVQYHVPAPGETVPDFSLLNQSDRKIDLKQYRGKVVLMTFIYTRCPLADYCPRMSRNFAEIDAELAKDPKLYGETHLLSVSFDPAYDTPKVLKSYGGAYTGRYSKEAFGHWTFAAPQGPELLEMEKWFAVGVTPGQNGTLQHSLATVVIGKDGKVISFYPSNDWTVAQVMSDVRKAAGA